MRIFKNAFFTRFARKSAIRDSDLCAAVANMERGLIDADLGGGVFKQRIARGGEGKSGGFRTIVLLRVETHAFFVYGFAKNSQANIDAADLAALKRLAKEVLAYEDAEIAKAVREREFVEIRCEDGSL